MQLLGERLRTLREGLNMTQVQIGELPPSGSITVRRDCINDDPTNAIYIGNELFSIRHGGIRLKSCAEYDILNKTKSRQGGRQRWITK